MKFGSVCSGIEAASEAWNPLGWKAAFFSEIDPFASAVLAQRHPTVPNLGDMTNFKDWPDATLDVLCGGTPCQSFSNAGLRAGLDDPRGQLMLTFGAIAARYRPKWLVWENVPGVLSSNGGRDFGAFLGLLGFLGYGFAYRVLDAQFVRVDGYGRAVPQRRQRVFVVGCLGDWRSAAAVLLEREGLRGDSAPRRRPGETVAPCIRAGAANGGAGHGARSGDSKDELIVPVDYTTCILGEGVSGTLEAAQSKGNRGLGVLAYGGNNTSGPRDVASALSALSAHGGSGRMDFESETFVAHTLRGDGFDASEDGTGRGTPLVPVLPFDATQITSPSNYSNPKPGDPCHPLVAGGHAPAVAFNRQGGGTQTTLGYDPDAGVAGSLHVGQTPAIAFQERGREGGRSLEVGGDVAYAMTAPAGGGRAQERNIAHASAVRRLMPVECERLQGFPDGHTAILYRGKPAADGPRYKAIGNSWAVNCARWLGHRIEMVDGISRRNMEMPT